MTSDQDLDAELTRPSDALRKYVTDLDGPLLVLGAGGKMGPSLCGMVKRAAEDVRHSLDVIAVSRFSNPDARAWLESRGIRTISCDLFDREAVSRLPDAFNVIYLVGLKFGTQENPALTWAANALVPSIVAERYASSRIVALSTGNVYPLSSIDGSGSKEGDPLTPLGEYANACVARERIFQYYTQVSSLRAVLIRLNYAVEPRYGVLVDIARKVAAGESVDVTTGYFNCIWQRDANDMIVRALELAESPARALNLTGIDKLSVREIALRLGELLDREVRVTGEEASTAFLSDASIAYRELGAPDVDLEQMLDWTAQWVQRGGTLLGKPTHFQVRDGRY